jgi:hypothetical protein
MWPVWRVESLSQPVSVAAACGVSVAAGDKLAPGKTVTYTWLVTERSGPGPADLGSIMWMYHRCGGNGGMGAEWGQDSAYSQAIPACIQVLLGAAHTACTGVPRTLPAAACPYRLNAAC